MKYHHIRRISTQSIAVFSNYCGRWFEFLLIESSGLLGFLKGLYEPFIKLNVMSKKSAMSILKSPSWQLHVQSYQ